MNPSTMSHLSISDEYSRRGIETIFLENSAMRVEVLSGKGGDITEIRDKRTDVNILFEVPFEWRVPSDGPVGAPDAVAAFEDHYPGGWQSILPNAGGPSSNMGATLAQHGESSIIPWQYSIREKPNEITVQLEASLTRYPFSLNRNISLRKDDPTLYVNETVTNEGNIPIQYSWLEHIALGKPLIGPDAEFEVDCGWVMADPDHDHCNRRINPGASFDWPGDEAGIDLQTFPGPNSKVFDLFVMGDVSQGKYTVRNPTIDLGVTVAYDNCLFEYLWYWGAFNGHDESPFFGRNYNVGLEPATSCPIIGGLDGAIENETANVLEAGESIETEVSLQTHSS